MHVPLAGEQRLILDQAVLRPHRIAMLLPLVARSPGARLRLLPVVFRGAAEQMVCSQLTRSIGLGEMYYILNRSGPPEPKGLVTSLGAVPAPELQAFIPPQVHTLTQADYLLGYRQDKPLRMPQPAFEGEVGPGGEHLGGAID